MSTKRKSRPKSLRPRLRIHYGDEIALGPGKAELLAWIDQTGSITEAAKRLGMSYMRAWMLIKTMNQCFKEPLVKAARGGPTGGGTGLTATGKKALSVYQQMDQASRRAVEDFWPSMEKLLAD
jgi:molybdate transport system regulatory protein